MRSDFAEFVRRRLKKDKNLYVLLGGVGYGVWDRARKEFPEKVINVEASEQAMLDMAVGLALADKNPICYSITPFLLYRPFEAIRNYLHHEQIPVKLVGCGRMDDYKDLGFTHFAGDDWEILRPFDINCYWPEDDLESTFDEVINSKKPCYLNLSRS